MLRGSLPGTVLLVATTAASLHAKPATWVYARSPHFTVVSNDSEKRARQVAEQFEQFRALHQLTLPARVDPPAAIVIFAVKGERSMKELLPGYWERKGGKRPSGVFISRQETVYVVLRTDLWGSKPDSVVYHEYAHLLNRLNFRWLPLWLDEGLAEFYETAEFDKDYARIGGILPRHLQLLRRRRLLPLRSILMADYSSPLYNEANRATMFYAQSAVLTHFLLMGDSTGGKERSVPRFLELLREGVEEAGALRRAFGELSELESDLYKYVQQFRFYYAKVPNRPQPYEIPVRPLPSEVSAALRAVFLARTGRPREATTLVDEALSLAPDLAMAHEARGHLLQREGKHREARRSFDQAARLDPQSYLAHFYGATSPAALDDVEGRERGLRRAIELQPRFAPAYRGLAELMMARGENLEEGLALAREAVRLRPYDSFYQLTLMNLLQRMERLQEVSEIEAGLLRAAHSDPRAHDALMAFYRGNDRWQDAERLLRRAVEQNPTATVATMRLARFLEGRDRPDEAEAVLRAGLKQQPDSPALLNNLSYLNAERGVRLQEALSLINKALKSEPERSSSLDTKGWVLFRLKRYAEAEKCLRKALSQRQDPVGLDHLGDVLKARGALAEALDCWRQALDHPFGSEELKASLREKIQAAEESLETGRQSELPSPGL